MKVPAQDDFANDPTRGWRMDSCDPRLSGGIAVPNSTLRSVAAASTAHGVSDGEPQRAGASSQDARMMRAAIHPEPDPWLMLAGEFHASSDVEIKGS